MNPLARPVALVLGVNGQDGSLAAQSLLLRGYEVHGVGRQAQPVWITPNENFKYIPLDLRSRSLIGPLVEKICPDLILHLAAVHGAAGFDDQALAEDIFAVNLLSLQATLEAMVKQAPESRIVYAGSSHVFGLPPPAHIDLQTPRLPHNIYAVSKLAAAELVALYRRRFGLAASVLHFFNHESERRPDSYFIPRLLAGLRKSLSDPAYVFKLSSLDFQCDWGCAREYMEIAIDTAQTCPGKDFIVATGTSVSGRDLAQKLFAAHGLDYRKHIEVTASNQADLPFKASTEPLLLNLGRVPRRTIFDVCADMLKAGNREKAA
ncbi:MAG: NAD-dependent epimerase/dehydratase family protein [Rhodospirillales bacterium]|nr:MAG: NAD-dependent epimerase/dehydratase family protein [Rhodospirillales bacterium]